MTELQNLPPGWDSIFDEKLGRYYYINHYTKMTTWDDPRSRHRPLHGTPKHFQAPTVDHIPLQDMKPKMSWTVKSPKLMQDTSMSVTAESEDVVAKIALMFPTVPETHIKMLLRKYHDREALVISALQVEKYPITTPGPFATPPPQMRGLRDTPPLGAIRATVSCRSSPRTQSSPKLKLRYMKSIFPGADETVILDVLQNNENNIQKTAENLSSMGFTKKDTVKIAQQKMEAKKEEDKKKEDELKVKQPSPVKKIKTDKEKKKMKVDLQEKYKDVPEHLITIALESVNFNESRANQILQIVIQEDTQNNEAKKAEETQLTVVDTGEGSATKSSIPISQSRQSIKSLMKAEKELEKITYCRVVEESEGNFVSKNLLNTCGPNHALARGANEKLLLEDYVKWHGPNPNLRRGSSNLAKGPNKNLLSNRTYQACGANKDLRKGAQCGLAKGSVFAQLKSMVIGDSRVK